MENTRSKLNIEKGITLVALVVTIIVLLILAGVTISLVLGDNGIIGKAKLALIETEKSEIVEDLGMVHTEANTKLIEKQLNTPSYTIKDIYKDSIDTSRENYSNAIWNNVRGTISDVNLDEARNKVVGEIIKGSKNEYDFEIDIISGEVKVEYKNAISTSSAFTITYTMESDYLPVRVKVYPHVEGYQTTVVDYASMYGTYEEFANYILGTLSTDAEEREAQLKEMFIEGSIYMYGEPPAGFDLNNWVDEEFSRSNDIETTMIENSIIKPQLYFDGPVEEGEECYVTITCNKESKTINLANTSFAEFVINENGNYDINAKNNQNGDRAKETINVSATQLSEILEADANLILREDGVLSYIDGNSDGKVTTNAQLAIPEITGEVTVCDNVKKLLGKNYFVTNDDKLYKCVDGNPEFIANDFKSIMQEPDEDWGYGKLYENSLIFKNKQDDLYIYTNTNQTVLLANNVDYLTTIHRDILFKGNDGNYYFKYQNLFDGRDYYNLNKATEGNSIILSSKNGCFFNKKNNSYERNLWYTINDSNLMKIYQRDGYSVEIQDPIVYKVKEWNGASLPKSFLITGNDGQLYRLSDDRIYCYSTNTNSSLYGKKVEDVQIFYFDNLGRCISLAFCDDGTAHLLNDYDNSSCANVGRLENKTIRSIKPYSLEHDYTILGGFLFSTDDGDFFDQSFTGGCDDFDQTIFNSASSKWEYTLDDNALVENLPNEFSNVDSFLQSQGRDTISEEKTITLDSDDGDAMIGSLNKRNCNLNLFKDRDSGKWYIRKINVVY